MADEAKLDKRVIVDHVIAGSSPVVRPLGSLSNGKTLLSHGRDGSSILPDSTMEGTRPDEEACLESKWV